MNKQKQDAVLIAWTEYCDSLHDVNLIETGVPPMFEQAFVAGVERGLSAVEKYKKAKDSGSNLAINAAKREIEALG